jgi:hypothetical protein
MGKYSTTQRSTRKMPERVHPIWRGIGFAMMILIPIMSYAGMELLMQYNQQKQIFPIPMDLLNKSGGDSLLFVKIGVFLVLLLILYAMLLLFTFLINRLFAPSRYGPFDVPQVAYRHKKRP